MDTIPKANPPVDGTNTYNDILKKLMDAGVKITPEITKTLAVTSSTINTTPAQDIELSALLKKYGYGKEIYTNKLRIKQTLQSDFAQILDNFTGNNAQVINALKQNFLGSSVDTTPSKTIQIQEMPSTFEAQIKQKFQEVAGRSFNDKEKTAIEKVLGPILKLGITTTTTKNASGATVIKQTGGITNADIEKAATDEAMKSTVDYQRQQGSNFHTFINDLNANRGGQ